MIQSFSNIIIKAITASVPKKTVTREEFADTFTEKELNKFEKTTGIKERRFADQNVTASDLGFDAANRLLKEENCKDEIRALIFLSQTPDYKIPFTSNLLQKRLGLEPEVLCIDINAGCAGFVQGLGVCYSMAQSINGKILFVVAETLSKLLSLKDKSTAAIFGDGAAALIIEKDESSSASAYFNYFSDGDNADAIMVPEGGAREPFNDSSLDDLIDDNGSVRNNTNLYMDGPRVFDFTLREIPKSITILFEDTGKKAANIDVFCFHQSNRFIIKQISRILGIPQEKIVLNIERFGNTSGVSIPLLIVSELESNKEREVLFCGYGAGLNWANCITKLTENTTIYELNEI